MQKTRYAILLIIFFPLLALFVGCIASPTAGNLPTPIESELVMPTLSSTDLSNKIEVIEFNVEDNISKNICDIEKYPSQTTTNEKNKILLNNPESGLYFFDPESGGIEKIPDTQDIFAPLIASSPDNTKVAYFDLSGSGMVISLNEPVVRKKFLKNKSVFYGWISNKQVIFADESHSDGSMVVFDIEDDTTQELITNLEDINFDTIHWYANGSQPSVIFETTLTRFIYLSNEIPITNTFHAGFIMRDYDTHKTLWVKSSYNIGVRPKWSPDGKFAAVVIAKDEQEENQIYILGKDGEELRIVQINNIAIKLIEWSPDSKKIGFSFSSISNNSMLGVYDINSSKLKVYPLDDEISRIVWSPNGNQIATKGFIVDTTTDCLFKLTSNDFFGPLAWLKINQ